MSASTPVPIAPKPHATPQRLHPQRAPDRHIHASANHEIHPPFYARGRRGSRRTVPSPSRPGDLCQGRHSEPLVGRVPLLPVDRRAHGHRGARSLYLWQREEVGVLGFIGIGLAVMRLVLITGAMYFEAFIAPSLAARAPELFQSFPRAEDGIRPTIPLDALPGTTSILTIVGGQIALKASGQAWRLFRGARRRGEWRCVARQDHQNHRGEPAGTFRSWVRRVDLAKPEMEQSASLRGRNGCPRLRCGRVR